MERNRVYNVIIEYIVVFTLISLSMEHSSFTKKVKRREIERKIFVEEIIGERIKWMEF